MSEREAYVQKLKAQLDEWGAEIDKLEARSRQAGADARIGYEREIAALRQQRDDAKARLAEAQTATEDAWGHLKEGLDSAWADLKTSLQKAASSFKS